MVSLTASLRSPVLFKKSVHMHASDNPVSITSCSGKHQTLYRHSFHHLSTLDVLQVANKPSSTQPRPTAPQPGKQQHQAPIPPSQIHHHFSSKTSEKE